MANQSSQYITKHQSENAEAWRRIKAAFPLENLETKNDIELMQWANANKISLPLVEYRNDDRFIQELFGEKQTEQALKGLTKETPTGEKRQAEIKYVEKAHPPTPTTNEEGKITTPESTIEKLHKVPPPPHTPTEQATERLETIVKRAEKTSGLIGVSGLPLQSAPQPSELPPPPIDESPTQQSPPPPPGAEHSSLGISNFMRAGRSLTKTPGKEAAEKPAEQLAKKILFRVPPHAWVIIGLILLFVLIFTFILANGMPSIGTVTNPGDPGGPGSPGGNIASCSFTRSGVSAPYKSATLLTMISNAAAKEGIPPAILASIARHESPEFTTNADDTHSNILTNNYCNPGQPVCVKNGKNINTNPGGIGECTPEQLANGAVTARAMGLMQVMNIFHPNTDLCNIKENIRLGAKELRSKLDVGGSFDNELQARRAVCRYFNIDDAECVYDAAGHDYGREVWQDYQTCNATAQPIPGLAGIVQAAYDITKKLITQLDDCNGKPCLLFGKKTDEPSLPVYWCTYLIVDAYNKMGLSGLTRSAHGLVVNMKKFFTNTTGYTLLPPETNVTQLKPGNVIFFEGKGQHVSLINSIDIDELGNGAIHTYDSNNVVTEDVVSVKNYQAIEAKTTKSTYSITGFGQAINL